MLFCLVMITSSYNSGLYARYATSANVSDSARVARYDVSVSDLSNSSLSLNSFDKNALSATTQITVSSNSEVAVKYSVVLTFASALPNWMHVTLDGAEPAVEGSVYTFADAGSFPAGQGNSDTLTLAFSVDPGLMTQDLSLSGIAVDVIVEQID